MIDRQRATDFDKELLELYDKYVHGLIDRRLFLSKAARFAVGGLTATAILESLNPNYALARQVDPADSRISTEYLEYDSPDGHGRMRGYFAKPAKKDNPMPGVIVVHENRGLNPYVEDVARRLAVAGFAAFGPDALTPLGGYPGNDDEGRAMQRKLERSEIVEDFVSATRFLAEHQSCDGEVGVVGFCFGGWMSNTLAWRLPNLIKAAVPFYGGQPSAEDTAKIKASLLLQYGELDERVNKGWPAYEEALKANDIEYTAHFYSGANHGFHNDTTPRFDPEAAQLAWKRTVDFFDAKLKG